MDKDMSQEVVREKAPRYGADDREYTYGDYEQWSEDERYELIDGKVFAMSAPWRLHQEILGALFTEFSIFLRGKNCKVYIAPFDIRLPKGNEPDKDIKTVVQPDLSVICDRKKLDDKGCRGAPDLIIEVISPSSIKLDISKKKSLYERVGVREYWIVYPAEKIVVVYKLDDQGIYSILETYKKNEEIIVEVLEPFSIQLETIFTE